MDSSLSSPTRTFGFFLLAAVCASFAATACTPAKPARTPVSELATLASLEAVMEEQEHTAEPHFGKVSAATLSDDDFATLADVGERLVATSARTKAFSRGPEFDALADKLGGHAKALLESARAKDVTATKAALGEVEATCEGCHSKFR